MSIHEKIETLRQQLAEAEVEAEAEAERDARRRALEQERRSAEVRLYHGKARGEKPMGQPLSVLGDVSGDEQAAEAEATIGAIDHELASLDAA